MSNDRLQKLREGYEQSFPEKANALEEAWRSVESSFFSESEIANLRELVHKLAGSAGMYGYDALAVASKSIEKTLVAGPEDSAQWRRDLGGDIQSLLASLRDGGDTLATDRA